MQPYFLPYIGYFQLIRAVDEFVIYDNIKYTKKGWINRNRFLQNGRQPSLFSIPLDHAPDCLDVRDRHISGSFQRDRLINQLRNAYAKAPHFECFPVIEEVLNYRDTNLFGYIHHSVRRVCAYLGIDTPIVVSSQVGINHSALRAQEKVLAICRQRHASHYINPSGGTALYSREEFSRRGIELSFLKTGAVGYVQFGNDFVENLSILDVMMFNPRDRIAEFLDCYSLA